MTPRNAARMKDICALRTDNHDTAEGWIILEENAVTLCTQRKCQPSTGTVTFSRRAFHKLIDWYQRDQEVRNE